MSKIRNLFNKFKKKKKSDQDFNEIFSDDMESDQDLTGEFEINQELESQDIDEDFVEDEADIELPPLENIEDNQSIELDTVSPAARTSDDSDESFEEDFTSEIPFDHEDLTNQTDEIDLTQSGFSLKDKVDHMSMRVKDKFRRLKTKDLNQALKPKESKTLKQNDFINQFKTEINKINFQTLPNDFFKIANHGKYHRYFQVSAVVLSAVTVGKIGSNIISGTPDYSKLKPKTQVNLDSDKVFTRDDLNQIKGSNIFKTDQVAQKKEDKPVIQTNEICKKASRKSSLPIKLVNTIVLQDSVKSIASVQVRSSKKLEVFREGQKISSLAKLDRIDDSILIVKNLKNGQCESIESTSKHKLSRRSSSPRIQTASPRRSQRLKREMKKITGIKNDGNNFEIKKDFLKSKMQDISSLLTQARGIPITNPDGTMSFKVTDIDPGGIFAYLGQQDGDIITQINGEPIKDMNQVMNLFGSISNISKLSLTIKRNGEEIEQNYNVK